MFELWKEDQSRVRLDENSQVSSFLGAYWIDRTNWTYYNTPPYSSYDAQLDVHNDTSFVMMGTTDGQVVAIQRMVQGSGVKTLYLTATDRAGMWFYCFGAKNITNSNCGLQFLDTAGNVTFDAQGKWLRLAGRVRNPVYNQDYPWPTGVPTIAVGMSQHGQWLQPNMQGLYRSFMIMSYGLRVSTGLAAQRVVVRQGPLGDANSPQPPPGDLFFADVTRY
jgi:hypothetical protein